MNDTNVVEKTIEEGTRRTSFCTEANEQVEQEWTGGSWLCLHDNKENENKLTVGIGNVLVCQWGYSMSLVDFYEVVKETTKTLLVRKMGEKLFDNTGFMCGHVIPDRDKKEDEQLRVYKRTSKNGDGFYLISRKHGHLKLYHAWDGEPVYFNHAD